MADRKRSRCLKRRYLTTTSFAVFLCFPLVVTGASTDFSPTEPTFAVATTNPMIRRQPITRYVESSENYDDEEPSPQSASSYPTLREPFFSPSQLLLTLMRTVVDVLKIVNEKRREHNGSFKKKPSLGVITNVTGDVEDKISDNTTLPQKNSNESSADTARGMDHGVIYDDYPHDQPQEPASPMPMTEAPKEVMKQSRYTDPWEGYYEFIITEGSFKFWSAFQLVTAALLLYSALAAIYYAKFNPIQPDYDTTYDDYFFGRSLEGAAPEPAPDSAAPAPGWISGLRGMGRAAYQRIMDAIHAGEEKF